MKEKYVPVREVKALFSSLLVLGKGDQNTKDAANAIIDNLPSVEIDPDDIPKKEKSIKPKACPFCGKNMIHNVLWDCVHQYDHPNNGCILGPENWDIGLTNDADIDLWNRRADGH